MTTIKNLGRQLVYTAIFYCSISTAHAQDDKTSGLPKRPNFSATLRVVDAGTIDNIVVLSFNLLRSVDEIASKVQGIESQLQGSIPDASLLLNQIEDCTNALKTVGSTTPALADDVANLIGNIKDLHIPLLRIPLALKNLNEARKAIQYCIGYTKYIIASAIPVMKQKAKSADMLVTTTAN